MGPPSLQMMPSHSPTAGPASRRLGSAGLWDQKAATALPPPPMPCPPSIPSLRLSSQGRLGLGTAGQEPGSAVPNGLQGEAASGPAQASGHARLGITRRHKPEPMCAGPPRRPRSCGPGSCPRALSWGTVGAGMRGHSPASRVGGNLPSPGARESSVPPPCAPCWLLAALPLAGDTQGPAAAGSQGPRLLAGAPMAVTPQEHSQLRCPAHSLWVLPAGAPK